MFLIKKPHHSEKSLSLNNQNKYTFIVAFEANKSEIKKQIEKHYKVSITSVNTMLYSGKKTAIHRRDRVIKGQKARFKKAIVTVGPNDIIDIYA